MIRLNKKFLISIIALLVLFATVFAVLSFTLADESNDTRLTADANSTSGPSTIIDYIIEFSNSTDDKVDHVYHILELGSSDTPSALESLVSSEGFRKYVLNENTSDGYSGEMTSNDKIEYIYYNACEGKQGKVTVSRSLDADGNEVISTSKSPVADDEIVKAIQKSDLIYLSNDADNRFVKGNDISENVKIALSSYVTNDEKPLIIDSHRLTIQSIIAGVRNMGDIVSTDFKRYGNKYATKKWDDSLDAESYMNPTRMDFVGINGNDAQSKWLKYDDGTGVKNTAKVLTIRKGSSDVALTTKLRSGINTVATINATSTDAINNSDLKGLDLNNLYELPDTSALHKYGYRGRSVRPDYVYFDTLDLDDVDGLKNLADTTKYDLSTYDFVLIEAGTKTVDFSHNKEAENSLLSAMYTGVHILYSSSLYTAKEEQTIPENTASNYAYVYDKAAYSTDVAKFGYVLVGTRKKMNSYSKATSGEGVKDIAEIINAGNFRSLKGNSSDESSNIYTALEIEPSYPIDTTLAQLFNTSQVNGEDAVRKMDDPLSLYGGYDQNGNVIAPTTKTFENNSYRGTESANKIGTEEGWGDRGFYYLRTDAVLDATPDEISYDGVNPLTTLLSNYDAGDTTLIQNTFTQSNAEHIQDYYKWNLSEAKVAHALGLSNDEVKVVHMSSAEFAASKVSLLDNYDMIYIGGNNSALADEKTLNSYNNADKFYRMYRHNGDTYVGDQYPDKFNGYVANTIGVLTGNDITDDKLSELNAYLDADMPVVIDKDVTFAFDNGTDIDPQSNMYAFLTEANKSAHRAAGKNALWNFDYDSTVRVPNDDGKYGHTYGGFATVFGGLSPDMASNEDEEANKAFTGSDVIDEKYLSPLIKNRQRPRFLLVSMPKKYIEGDPNSYITVNDFKFKYSINSNVSADEETWVRVYIDDDSNNRFTENNPVEIRYDQIAEGKSGEASVTLPSDYFGVVYWKFEIYTKIGDKINKRSSTTGTCKIANTNNDKMVIDLLEILPVVKKNSPCTNNTMTLCFCTECDMSKTIYTQNRLARNGKFHKDMYKGSEGNEGDCSYFTEGTNYETIDEVVDRIKKDNYYKPSVDQYSYIDNFLKYEYEGSNIGLHDHKFGIVKYYSNYDGGGIYPRLGMDDITTNWFEDIRSDYDVNLTVLTTKEYDNIVNIVNDFYSDETVDDEVFNYRYEEIKSGLIENFKNNLSEEEKANYSSKTDEDIWNETSSLRDDMPSDADIRASITKDYKVEYYKNKFNEEYEKYNSYYNAIHNLLNGKDASTTGLPFVIPDIDKYQGCVSDLDTFLTSPYNGKSIESLITSKGFTNSILCQKEIALETDSSIPGSERNYYDFFSLVGNGDVNGLDGLYTAYSEKYKVWRNAKVYELYFEKMAQKYKLLSSVNTDGNYKDTINISNTFNCIVLGGAVDFHIDNGTDDLKPNSCSSLLDYVDDNSNLILFHGSLTAKKGSTYNMSNMLRDAFGQDPRHQEYYYSASDYKQQSNQFVLNIAGVNKTFVSEPDVNEYKFDVVKGEAKDIKAKVIVHFSSSTKELDEITIPKNVTNADLQIFIDDSGNVSSANLVPTKTGNGDHTIEITPMLVQNYWDGVGPWNRYHTPDLAAGASYKGDVKSFELVLDGKSYDLKGKLLTGSDTVVATNYSLTVSDEQIVSRVTDNFDANTQITQSISVRVVDGSGNPVENVPVDIQNVTTGETISEKTKTITASDGSTSYGGVVYDFSNFAPVAGATAKVQAKSGYKTTEYFISDTLGNRTPNTYTLTPYKALRDAFFDGGGSVLLPFKYTSFSNQMSEEQAMQRQNDNRDKIHNGLNETTDKTSQVNKGIVTTYPFAIGNQMKISTTEPQSYSVDIEDPNLTVYYTMAGGTSGTVSSYLAADPHNGQDNYFIYQYNSVYYCGAGHSNVTGYGKDNNDERRLFINIIVNSARKSTAAPDLTLHDVESYYDTNSKKNVTYNTTIAKCVDGTADYVTYISDYADQIEFKFLPTISEGAKLQEVIAWYDKNRTDSEKNKYTVNATDSSLNDPLIYKHGYKANFVDSGVLTRIGLGEEGLQVDSTNIPLINLKPEYFDASNTAYIGVMVTDDKGNTITKMLKIQFKEDLLDLN